MMGEDGTDNLDELEDSWARTQAEMDAVEAGGTGLSYYNDDAVYDYEASNQLTDIDYQGPDESDQYTANNTGADDYNPVGRSRQDDDDQDEYGEEDAYGWDDDDDDDDDDYDDDDDDDADEDNEDDEDDVGGGGKKGTDDDGADDDGTDNDGAADAAQGGKKGKKKGAGEKGQIVDSTQKENDYDGFIKWKPGQEITVELLKQSWEECRKVPKVRGKAERVNAEMLSVLRMEQDGAYIYALSNIARKFIHPSEDFLGTLLALDDRWGQRLFWVTVSTFTSIFITQAHRETTGLAALPTVLRRLIKVPDVYGPLALLYQEAVPIVNKKHRRQ